MPPPIRQLQQVAASIRKAQPELQGRQALKRASALEKQFSTTEDDQDYDENR